MNTFARVIEFATRRPKFAIFLVMIAAGLVVAFLFVGTDRYPILVVNGAPISARRFEMNYNSAAVYYNNLLKSAANNATATAALGRITVQDLEVDVLDQLVVAVLVDEGSRRYVGSDIDQLVQEKIDQYASDPSLKQGVATLYGMSFADFKDEVLVPQAQRDILAGRLFLEGKNVNDWLADARKAAQVSVLTSKFKWDGERIVAAQ